MLMYKCDRCGVEMKEKYYNPDENKRDKKYYVLHECRHSIDLGRPDLCESCNKDFELLIENFFREKEPVKFEIDEKEMSKAVEESLTSKVFKRVRIIRG